MKFYLSSVQDWEPYNDLSTNELMKGYCQMIERETDAKVTFEKDTTLGGYQHIVVDIPSMKVLVQIIGAIGYDLVIDQQSIDENDKYPTIFIHDGYIE